MKRDKNRNAKTTSQSLGNKEVFKKSSYSGGGDCVEVAKSADGAILVRDSKNKSGPKLSFTTREWNAFLGGVRKGEFDI